MTDKNKVWIDSHGRATRFLDDIARKRKEEAERRQKEEAERRRREAERRRRQEAEQRAREYEERQRRWKEMDKEKEQAQAQTLSKQPKVEILLPASKTPALAPPDGVVVPGLDLAEFERQIRNSAQMLDLSVPEGFLDRLIGRPDHRIRVKTERGRLMAGYIAACTAIIQAAGSLQDARGQVYLNQLILLRRVAEENYKLELTRRQLERQDAIEEVKAREIIAENEAKIRENGLRGRPVPPPLAPPPAAPPPPPPTPAELRAKKKASLKQDLDRLDKEEKDELAKITGGKPQGEWTEEMKEDIRRTTNMYYHAKQKVRDELREYL